MINGPGADYFVSNDIVAIHMIIIDSLREEVIKKLNIDQLNRDLGHQIEQLLKNVDINKINKNHEVRTAETGDATCPKCNKKCRTRSTYCTVGQHWVHYKWQTLTDQEIQVIENSKSEDQYQCKLCREQRGSVKLASMAKPTAQDHAQELLYEELTFTSTISNSLPDDFCGCVI